MLESEYYVSSQTIQRIDKMTSLMMESGLNRYFQSFGEFKEKFFERSFAKEKNNEFQALNVVQLKRPAIFILCMYGITLIIFLIETALSKLWAWYRG